MSSSTRSNSLDESSVGVGDPRLPKLREARDGPGLLELLSGQLPCGRQGGVPVLRLADFSRRVFAAKSEAREPWSLLFRDLAAELPRGRSDGGGDVLFVVGNDADDEDAGNDE